ncbi:MAG: TIGR02680 family protein [Eubacteriales bacterium]
MNSSWVIHKIGLVDFWYYDEQEFSFIDGRMLLRGSNGSGKSVTMQSVVPLLLDGNIRPERLDPFGSRDRKMVNYLLEDGDGREERTGYLYMELKRKDSDTYLTIGMGLRARKSKPLNSWYFSITDGRRINKDFALYRATDVKITLTQKELENRLGDGGKIFQTQQEYMEYVNRQVFGFESLDAYKEMIDLLIQLRTPKLSKDFKPSVINEILSDSLQPLTEEDLRPMSEAIENMDTLTVNVANRNSSKQAVDKIIKHYKKYNEFILYEKASLYVNENKAYEKLEEEIRKSNKQLAKGKEKKLALEEENMKLHANQKVLEKEKESLNTSDEVSLKQKELEVAKRMEQMAQTIDEKEKQLEEKKEKWNEYHLRMKNEQDEKENKKDEIAASFESLEEQIEDFSFDEHTFFSDELQENLEEEYDFSLHIGASQGFLSSLETGFSLLEKVDEKQRVKEEQELIREQKLKEKEAGERKLLLLDTQFSEIQNELIEQMYRWKENNQELIIGKETLQKIHVFIDEYHKNSDYNQVRELVGQAQFQCFSKLQEGLIEKTYEKKVEEKKQSEIDEELTTWLTLTDPEPEVRDAVAKNRKKLAQAGIPYQRFYQMIDFETGISNEQANMIEESLLEMGLLDALIIDSDYKEQVLTLDTGMCDRYIFTDHDYVSHNILDWITIGEDITDIFLNQKVMGVLGSIGFETGNTFIGKDGTYGMGILTGTVTGQYQAGFIGVKAREKKRLQKIATLEEALASQKNIVGAVVEEIAVLEKRIAVIKTEYENMPPDEDLRIACLDCESEKENIEKIQQEILLVEAHLLQMEEELKSLWKEAVKIAESIYLPCRLSVFQNASAGMKEYCKELYRLQNLHMQLVEKVRSLIGLEEVMADCDEDMDTIRYELGKAQKSLFEEQTEYNSIKAQLALTNYEAIKEQLDYCMKRLEEIPMELEENIRQTEKENNNIENLQKFLQESEEKTSKLEKRVATLQRNFEKELFLGYVVQQETKESVHIETKEEGTTVVLGTMNQSTENNENSNIVDEKNTIRHALEVITLLESGIKDNKEILNGKVNESFFENRGYLSEYAPTMEQLFVEDVLEEQHDISPQRLELTGRYKGRVVKFKELVALLSEEIAQLNDLIKAGDKELFEDILANTISRKIRGKINNSITWVENMNQLMGSMNTSSGLKLSLRWRAKTAEQENQLDTNELVELLKRDSKLMRESEFEKLSKHFRSKVEMARRSTKETNLSFFMIMKETLDYRKWFEFQLFSQKNGEAKKELTNSVFGTFSGGEKAMSMYVPLFSAVVAKYQGARKDAPRIISLDEAFAGVDNRNIRDMFRLMVEFEFNFIINSQILWGDCDTLDSLAIYQLIRPENVKFVTVMPYIWNGMARVPVIESE